MHILNDVFSTRKMLDEFIKRNKWNACTVHTAQRRQKREIHAGIVDESIFSRKISINSYFAVKMVFFVLFAVIWKHIRKRNERKRAETTCSRNVHRETLQKMQWKKHRMKEQQITECSVKQIKWFLHCTFVDFTWFWREKGNKACFFSLISKSMANCNSCVQYSKDLESLNRCNSNEF